MSTAAPSVPVTGPDTLAETLGADALEEVIRAWPAEPAGETALPTGISDPVRVGVDLVPVADVSAALARHGRRYLYRVFTPHERACARAGAGLRVPPARVVAPAADVVGPTVGGYWAESLAARFAAKEAAVKVLRPVGPRPEWRSIEVRRMEGGWCELRLTGRAAALAAEARITVMAVSVTHEPDMAAACVVGMRTGDTPARSRTTPPDRRGK